MTFLDGKVTLHQGDCLEVLPRLEECSVDSCVTDPPYHLTSIVKRFGAENAAPAKSNGATGVYARASSGFMNKRWDGGDVASNPETWRAVFRVLKPGAHLIAFGGTRTAHRMACAIEDAGFEIRDTICWLYGSGFPKSHDVSKGIDRAAGAGRPIIGQYIAPDGNPRGIDYGIQGGRFAAGQSDYVAEKLVTAPATDAAREWSGWGTALKPAYEPIIMARKPLIGTVVANVLQHGTGAINVDGCRVEHVTVEGGNLALNPHLRDSINGGNGGTIFPAEANRRVVTPNTLGRWPANVIHDGSDEVVAAFPDVDGAVGMTQWGSGTTIGTTGIKHTENSIGGHGIRDSGSASRFFYTAKADSDDRLGSKHPTVKPLDLMQYLVRLVTPKAGRVLDCFAGSGTTGEAAWREGMRAVLIEREAEYCEDVARRMKLALSGIDERARESIKARNKDKPVDHGPLFGIDRRSP